MIEKKFFLKFLKTIANNKVVSQHWMWSKIHAEHRNWKRKEVRLALKQLHDENKIKFDENFNIVIL